MKGRTPSNFLDKARGVAAAGMIAAGAAAILGSLLDWVTIEAPALFTGAPSEPFTGVEARDGWWTLGGGVVLVAASVLLTFRRRSLYPWLGFLTSLVIGAIATADYRAIGDVTSPLGRRMDVVGDAEPAIGLILVAVSALIGAIASLTGVAATPRQGPE